MSISAIYYLAYSAAFFKTGIALEANVNKPCQYQQYYLPYSAPFFGTDITLEANVNKACQLSAVLFALSCPILQNRYYS